MTKNEMTPERAVDILDETLAALILLKKASNGDSVICELVNNYRDAVPIAKEAIKLMMDSIDIEKGEK